MRPAKGIGVAALAYLLAFLLLYSSENIHRRAFDKAFFDWYTNRTAENMAALEKERDINEIIRLRDSAIGATILVAVGYGTWATFRYAKRKRQSQSN